LRKDGLKIRTEGDGEIRKVNRLIDLGIREAFQKRSVGRLFFSFGNFPQKNEPCL